MNRYEELAYQRGQEMRRDRDEGIKRDYFCPYNFYTQKNLFHAFNRGWNEAYILNSRG